MARRRMGLLVTECAKDFARRHKKLSDQVGRVGAVGDAYVDDLAHTRWEIDRFNRIAAGLLNNACRQALENLLKQVLSREDFETHLDREHAAEDLAKRYFEDKEVKADVSELLRKFRLDEAAIEAEAFRLCAAELEAVNRIVAFKQVRCDKNLFVLSEILQGAFAPSQAPEPAREDAIPQLVPVNGS